MLKFKLILEEMSEVAIQKSAEMTFADLEAHFIDTVEDLSGSILIKSKRIGFYQ